MARNFENLRIWVEARAFVVEVYSLLKNNKDFGFRDQIQRASVSIMNNIAEGSEYNSDASFVKFLNIAKGSCAEVRSMLYLLLDLGYCTKEEYEKLYNQLLSISSGIFKLVDYLEKNKIKSGWRLLTVDC